jgi:hypothetical protein
VRFGNVSGDRVEQLPDVGNERVFDGQRQQ